MGREERKPRRREAGWWKGWEEGQEGERRGKNEKEGGRVKWERGRQGRMEGRKERGREGGRGGGLHHRAPHSRSRYPPAPASREVSDTPIG